MTEMQGKNVTESYFVSCRPSARAEMSMCVSVSAVGNVDVQTGS